MGDNSAIEWTDATWNPIAGCSIHTPGCTNCYAMKMAARIEKMSPQLDHYKGLTQPSKAGPVWTGKVTLAPDHILTQPLRWKRPRRIFVNSMADLFHADVPDAWIDKVFAVMALSPQHTFQVLTKRADRMRAWFAERWQATLPQRIDYGGGVIIDLPGGVETGRHEQVFQACEYIFERIPAMVDTNNDSLWNAAGSLKCRDFAWPLPNVWLGVSVEDQTRADERIPDLLATPAAVRFLSCEPLLGPLDLYNGDPDPRLGGHKGTETYLGDWWEPGEPASAPAHHGVDWVIAGGESGTSARASNPDWFRSLRDQCAAADVPFFFKQWGEWIEPIKQLPDEHRERIGNAVSSGKWNDRIRFVRGAAMVRVGKKAAGAILDGREHRELPT